MNGMVVFVNELHPFLAQHNFQENVRVNTEKTPKYFTGIKDSF